jgi:hypothetical protein
MTKGTKRTIAVFATLYAIGSVIQYCSNIIKKFNGSKN